MALIGGCVCGEYFATFLHKLGSKLAPYMGGGVAKSWPLILGFLVCNSTNSAPAV